MLGKALTSLFLVIAVTDWFLALLLIEYLKEALPTYPVDLVPLLAFHSALVRVRSLPISQPAKLSHLGNTLG